MSPEEQRQGPKGIKKNHDLMIFWTKLGFYLLFFFALILRPSTVQVAEGTSVAPRQRPKGSQPVPIVGVLPILGQNSGGMRKFTPNDLASPNMISSGYFSINMFAHLVHIGRCILNSLDT